MHWLLVRRSITDPTDLAYYLCFGPTGGRPAEDGLLQRIGQKILPQAPESHFAARVGGDSFALVVRDRPTDEMLGYTQRVLNRVRHVTDVAGILVAVRASAGLSPATCPPRQQGTLLRPRPPDGTPPHPHGTARSAQGHHRDGRGADPSRTVRPRPRNAPLHPTGRVTGSRNNGTRWQGQQQRANLLHEAPIPRYADLFTDCHARKIHNPAT
ncbi:diguanylate cyclase [Micromonospora sp. NBC_01655]|uniref:diguanylate cyclase domain-containing protein n=1 Tax=Micromonospora sp. NBC_01655 TaxID=2975983 RepID=UPI00338F9A71